MTIPAQKFREAVFQLLYSSDIGKGDADDLIDLIMLELEITKKVAKDAYHRSQQIFKKLPEIDGLISKTSQSYSFERIQTVERNILRLGIFELFFDDSIPPKVALAEAMRLTRKFGTKESASFVNAIMDTLYKESLGEKVDTRHITKLTNELTQSEKVAEEAALNKTDDIDDDK